MSGDTTQQALKRLSRLPDSNNPADLIAGQEWDNILFAGGVISGVTLNDITNSNEFLNEILPDQTGHTGEVLKTDGTDTYWSSDIDTGITQLTGDITAGPGSGSQVATLATVNSNVGSFGSVSSVPSITVNAKGLVTAASNVTLTSVGVLTGGSTGAGFTIALGSSTITGVLPAVNGGAGTVNGLLKANGSGTVSAATSGTDYVTASSTNTFTQKTYDTAGTGNSFSINGVAVTTNSGTGAVVRASGAALTGATVNGATPITSNQSEVIGGSTDYTLTASSAGVAFGSGSPILTLSAPGTYLITGYARFEYVAATFAVSRTLTLKLRRTNNTAADLSGSAVYFNTPIITTQSYTGQLVPISAIYTTANSNDTVQLFADISALPSAGSVIIGANGTALRANRLQQ